MTALGVSGKDRRRVDGLHALAVGPILLGGCCDELAAVSRARGIGLISAAQRALRKPGASNMLHAARGLRGQVGDGLTFRRASEP